MDTRPTQFTIRAIAIAIFWMAACLAALNLAKSGVMPSLFFVLAVLALCRAVYAIFKDSPASGLPGRWKSIVGAIVVWNLPIVPLLVAYRYTVGELVHAIYIAMFGEIEPSHAVYARVVVYVAYATVTLPATVISVWLFDKLSRRPWRWRRSALTIIVWEILVLLVLVTSAEIRFWDALHQVAWAVIIPADNLYTFQNVMLYRIIAWLIETTPIAWTSLWVHSKLA